MQRTILELSTPGLCVRKERGFLEVTTETGETVSVGLADLAAVVSGPLGATWTQQALVELASRGVPVVLCGARFLPEAVIWPISGHHEAGRRSRAQAALSAPTRKQAWKQIIKAKIQAQAAALRSVGAPSAPVAALVTRVRSGDPSNMEAQASRRYWQLLMGPDFRRDQDADGVNALLNYGYAIVRAAMARAVCAAGLHPALSISHCHPKNNFALVDDLMEPFRPAVDVKVHELKTGGVDVSEVTADLKRELAALLHAPGPGDHSRPLLVDIYALGTSAGLWATGERKDLDLPFARTKTKRTQGAQIDESSESAAVRASDDVAPRVV